MPVKPRLSQTRIQQHIQHKDDKPNGGGTRIVRSTGLSDYKPVEGANRFNVIPFPVRNPLYPPVAKGEIVAGEDWEQFLDVWVHSRIGEGNKDFLCLKQFGHACPLCAETSRLYDEADRQGDEKLKKRATDLKAKRRSLIIVQPIVKGEPQDLALFNASHFSFTSKLLKEANDNPDGGGPINFADPENGRVVYFRAEPSTRVKKAFDFDGFKFAQRDAELDVDWDKIPSLDELMVLPTKEDMEAALFGGPSGATKGEDEVEEDDAPPATSRAAARTEDAPPAQTRRAPEPEPEPEPAVTKAAPEQAAPPAAETKAPAATPSASGNTCPYGHAFGDDNGKHPVCPKCPMFDPCLDVAP